MYLVCYLFGFQDSLLVLDVIFGIVELLEDTSCFVLSCPLLYYIVAVYAVFYWKEVV